MNKDEVAALDAALGQSLEAVAPPAEAKSYLLRVVQQLSTVDGFRPIPNCAGVSVSVVTRDVRRGTVTVLLQFAPGAVLPGHRHKGSEQSYVVSGSCRIDDASFSKGDFHRIEPGTRHGDVVSENGCVLLITMDERDYHAA